MVMECEDWSSGRSAEICWCMLRRFVIRVVGDKSAVQLLFSFEEIVRRKKIFSPQKIYLMFSILADRRIPRPL